jgi:hypothetical protein
MRFEFYHSGLDNVAKLSIDGTVSHSVHFSHWRGNETPAEVKADTSTEIALNLVGSPNRETLTQGIELLTNNHFDTDGVLSVWTVLAGERALDLKDQLVAAAEAGDFSEFTNEAAVRASIVIQGADQTSPNEQPGSPLARHLTGENGIADARAYALVLPKVEHVLSHTEDFEQLWRGPWERIETALESFERGGSTVEEFAESNLSLITLAAEVFSPSGFNPTRHVAPYTAISRYARGEVYLIATPIAGGWTYRLDYPYYSWAETVVRPRIAPRDFTPLVDRLNDLETSSNSRWKSDFSEMTSAVKFLNDEGSAGVSAIAPDSVTRIFTELSAKKAVMGTNNVRS